MLTQSSWGRKGLALPFLGDPAKMTRDTDWRSMLRRYNGKGAQPQNGCAYCWLAILELTLTTKN